MKRILGISVPHSSQAYPTCGNYGHAHGAVLFTISEMGNEFYERLVFLHEFVEETLCMARGIKVEDIDKFDIEFEKNRAEGNDDEPGDDLKAPYRREHRQAENIERQFADLLGVDWDEYNRTVVNL